jgi:CHASE1-domain containing sensor protein
MSTTPHPPDPPPELEARLDRAFAASMQAFGLELRKRIGRPMTAEEWALAELAHSFGYTDGVQLGFDVAEESMERAAMNDMPAGGGQEA